MTEHDEIQVQPAELAEPADRCLSVRQLARRWGVSPRWIRDLIHRGVLPAFDAGIGSSRTRLRITPETVAQAERERAVKPRSVRRPRQASIDPDVAALLEDA